mmetsp:Transcript_14966/g.19596  ORF Transcript_14966/g.19596 Transcript_14966/m.19596 type:complete len:162 (+) Transcript_14966:28-513(+)|eukprot:CAMPEP_0198142800 /NCGR_PEP_ID=MMETSP1443-20131203/5491_1 /TAXON_ID=186043 /ORGANISM="Entomoneis sp., Strain CCMP2396" /LENGTH=161 /DNA_ID=CAMNT_0043805895 /DNA_START=33 /DNA_END=518 /DNA_ORIENTATION=-
MNTMEKGLHLSPRDSTKSHDYDDVIESFQILDVEGIGTILLEDLQTIYLGLGFLPTRFATLENFEREFGNDRPRVTLSEALAFLAKHPRADVSREVRATFDLWDSDGKGYLEARDVVGVAEDLGDYLSDKQASRLIHYSTMGEERLDLDGFQRIFPPSKSS